jgi:uncharacterized protein YqhQ
MAIAVRRPDGTIVVREDAWISIWERLRFLRWPLLRGGVVLIESLYNGIQALNFAASQAMPQEEAAKEPPSRNMVGIPHSFRCRSIARLTSTNVASTATWAWFSPRIAL